MSATVSKTPSGSPSGDISDMSTDPKASTSQVSPMLATLLYLNQLSEEIQVDVVGPPRYSRVIHTRVQSLGVSACRGTSASTSLVNMYLRHQKNQHCLLIPKKKNKKNHSPGEQPDREEGEIREPCSPVLYKDQK